MPGEYDECLTMGGKNVVLRAGSLGGPSSEPTTIRGDGTGPVIAFTSGETAACQVVGFVIAGGVSLNEGGAILCRGSSPTFINCLIQGNVARRGGGIASMLGAAPRLINCVLLNNSAELGGAAYCSGGDISLLSCTLAANVAQEGASLACRSPRLQQPGSVTMSNCILWDGPGEIANHDASAISIAYSDVLGGWPGPGNVNIDPLFVRSPDATSGNSVDLRLRPCSACADAGKPLLLPPDVADLDGDGDSAEPIPLDILGHLRLQGGSVDMGAYECARIETLPGDMDGDCEVDLADLLSFAACGTGPVLGPPSQGCEVADFDGDGDVDQSDFGIFQRRYGGSGLPADSDRAN